MIIAFHAKSVALRDPEDYCFLVGFADEPYETTQYLLLQRAFEHDEQDIELGHDTYHVELCDQANSGYGGISRCELHRNRLDLSFSADILAELNGVTGATITFQLADSDFSSLRQQLNDIFRGSGCYTPVGA